MAVKNRDAFEIFFGIVTNEACLPRRGAAQCACMQRIALGFATNSKQVERQYQYVVAYSAVTAFFAGRGYAKTNETAITGRTNVTALDPVLPYRFSHQWEPTPVREQSATSHWSCGNTPSSAAKIY